MARTLQLEGQLLDGRFFVQRRLGAGTFGTVYLAEQRIFDRRLRSIALKLFNEQLVSEENAGEVLNDAIILMQMQEDPSYPEVAPHLVTVLDAGFLGDLPGRAFMAMDYVSGYRPHEGIPIRTLQGLISAFRPVPVDLALRWMKQILIPVAWLHSRRPHVLHCDLKPDNILASGRDMLKVADFGLAQLTTGIIGTGGAAGGLTCQSPETLAGADPTPASDVYSLGLVFYEILAGYNPIGDVHLHASAANDPAQLRKYHLEARKAGLPSLHETAHPELNDHRLLVDIIERCLRFNGSDRYENAGGLLEDLQQYGPPASLHTGEMSTPQAHTLNRLRREVVLLIHAGSLDDAWQRSERAMEQFPDSARPFAWMAEVRVAQGLCPQALELCASGLQVNDREPEVPEAAACAYDATGQPDLAARMRHLAASYRRGDKI